MFATTQRETRGRQAAVQHTLQVLGTGAGEAGEARVVADLASSVGGRARAAIFRARDIREKRHISRNTAPGAQRDRVGAVFRVRVRIRARLRR